VLINYLIRLAVEKRGEEYLSFPQRTLFDKIGIRTMVLETDPFGNFLTQGTSWRPAETGLGLAISIFRMASGMANGFCRGIREVC